MASFRPVWRNLLLTFTTFESRSRSSSSHADEGSISPSWERTAGVEVVLPRELLRQEIPFDFAQGRLFLRQDD
jgi:hypothetical protein